MENLIDLDALVKRLESTAETWRQSAQVQPFTWRDAEADWPQPIVTDRSSVRVAEALGIRLDSDPDNELEVVVWTGGWADIGFLLDGEVTTLYAEFSDLDGAYAAVARTVEDFLA